MLFREQMIKLGACSEEMEWLGDRTFDQYWAECERADWMMWELSHRIDKRRLVGLAGKLAATVSHLYKKDSVVKDCIQATQDYSKGRISEEELKLHSDAASAASTDAAYYDTDAAYYAVRAAYYAVRADYYAACAAYYAAYAVRVCARATVVRDDAERKQHKIMCEIIRKEMSIVTGG
jgi:hypothetical protein